MGRELWQTNGTMAGTLRVANIYPGPSGSNPRNFAHIQDTLYLSAEYPGEGTEMRRFLTHAVGTQNLEELSDADFEVYPNPVSSVCFIQTAQERESDESLTLRNWTGQVVLKKNLKPSVTEFELGYLPNGLYTLQLGHTVKKVLVRH